MIMSSLDTYFLEVNDNASLKVTTKSSFRGKIQKFTIFWQFFWSKNRGVQPKKIKVSSADLALLNRAQIQFLEVGARISLKVATKAVLEVRKLFWDF